MSSVPLHLANQILRLTYGRDGSNFQNVPDQFSPAETPYQTWAQSAPDLPILATWTP